MTPWTIERALGSASELHGREVDALRGRTAWVLTVSTPSLVLGSTQDATDVDESAAADLGVAVVRRRSGGGAVLLDPGAAVWVDLLVPRGDPLWHDDVGIAAEWVGEAWVGALAALGHDDAVVHRGALVRTPTSPVVCFGGLGPGEVVAGGGKVVGLSQRRTRDVARFQCSALLGWDPDRHAALLAPGLRRVLPGVEPVEAVRELAVETLARSEPGAVVEALLEQLP